MWFWPLLLVKGWKILPQAFFKIKKIMEALMICCTTESDLVPSKKTKTKKLAVPLITMQKSSPLLSQCSAFHCSRYHWHLALMSEMCIWRIWSVLVERGAGLARYLVLPSCWSPTLSPPWRREDGWHTLLVKLGSQHLEGKVNRK